MNDLVVFIPARGGSKSIKDKNIKELGGKPLIVWSIESAFSIGANRVIVNTDSEAIADIARKIGADVMMRPPELAEDTTSMFDVLKSEIAKIDPLPRMVLLLQPTTPFRKKIHLIIALRTLKDNFDTLDSVISAERVPDKWNPAQVIIKTPLGTRMADGSLVKNRLTRRQQFPESWVPTGSVYLFKTTNLEGGSMYGDRVAILETEGTININSEEDFLEAQKLCELK